MINPNSLISVDDCNAHIREVHSSDFWANPSRLLVVIRSQYLRKFPGSQRQLTVASETFDFHGTPLHQRGTRLSCSEMALRCPAVVPELDFGF
jgi:hypothetical protein